MIYFDHNATSPLHPAARKAWLEASEQYPGNPSSPHRFGSRADHALEGARARLAEILGCGPREIVWTSGATESNNLALHHFSQLLPRGTEVWVSAVEHPCVLAGARFHFAGRWRPVPVSRAGVVELEWLEREARRRRPGFVAVMAANNETGVCQPWPAVGEWCRAQGVPFLCDATQWLGRLPGAGLGQCDFVSGSAHKFGGPKGLGFLKCPPGARLRPLLLGGPQEEGRRAGTENVAGALAMLAVLELWEQALTSGEQNQRESWRKNFERRMVADLPGAAIIGADAPRLWNTVSALMPETGRPVRWVVKLDKRGFAVSTGSACSSGRETPSHVLAALGYGLEAASRVLRFSSGWETPEREWRGLAQALRQVAAAT